MQLKSVSNASRFKKDMIKVILLLALIFSMHCLNAQSIESVDSFGCVMPIEIIPKWTKGTNLELINQITSTIQYPNEQCIEGTTSIQFIVDTLGQVKEPKIVRSISNTIDDQLLSFICRYKFEPGKLIDKKVEYIMNLPIRIGLR